MVEEYREFRAGSQMLEMIKVAARSESFTSKDLVGDVRDVAKRIKRQRLCAQVLYFLRYFGYLHKRPGHRPKRGQDACQWTSEKARRHIQEQLKNSESPSISRWTGELSPPKVQPKSQYSRAAQPLGGAPPRSLHEITEKRPFKPLAGIEDQIESYESALGDSSLKDSRSRSSEESEISRKSNE